MYVCMYVSMYLYICVYVCMCVYALIYVCMYVCVCMYLGMLLVATYQQLKVHATHTKNC
jgi:nuclear pore complex protein Nup62